MMRSTALRGCGPIGAGRGPVGPGENLRPHVPRNEPVDLGPRPYHPARGAGRVILDAGLAPLTGQDATSLRVDS